MTQDSASGKRGPSLERAAVPKPATTQPKGGPKAQATPPVPAKVLFDFAQRL